MKIEKTAGAVVGAVFMFALAGCSSSSSDGAAQPAAPATQTVIVEGQLADVKTAQTTHDQIFGGLQSQAAKLGNTGHDAFVGVQTNASFLALDTWDDPKGLDSFLHDPNVASADAMLFAGAPKLTIATPRDGWYGWGTVSRTLPDGSPAVVAVIRGPLQDPQKSKDAHNAGSKMLQPQSNAAGDVAHVVFLDSTDETAYIAIDVWANAAAAQKFYASPDLAAGFASVLAGAPTITLYSDTSWVQW